MEFGSLGLGISVFPLVALVSVEFHSFGLGGWSPPLGLGSGLAAVCINGLVHRWQRFSVDSPAVVAGRVVGALD